MKNQGLSQFDDALNNLIEEDEEEEENLEAPQSPQEKLDPNSLNSTSYKKTTEAEDLPFHQDKIAVKNLEEILGPNSQLMPLEKDSQIKEESPISNPESAIDNENLEREIEEEKSRGLIDLDDCHLGVSKTAL